ncbi:MAG: hypothetical protein ACREIV_02465, partial [Planctomycetaceae bacterium]
DGTIHQYLSDFNRPKVAQLDNRFFVNPRLLFSPPPSGLENATISLAGNVLTINPTAGFTGNLRIAVQVDDGTAADSETFTLSVGKLGLSDQTISYQQDVYQQTLPATNTAGQPLSYSVTLLSNDPVALRAQDLLDQRSFFDYTGGSFYHNIMGWGEKWFAGVAAVQGTGLFGGNADYFYILQDGSVHQFFGSGQGPKIGQLDERFWQNPNLLFSPPPASDPTDVTAFFAGNTLTIDPNADFRGTVQVQVRVNESNSTFIETFDISVTNAAPNLPAIGDQSISQSLDVWEHSLGATDPDNDPLTYLARILPDDLVAATAHDLLDELDFFDYTGGSFYSNIRGWGEKWFAGSAEPGTGWNGSNTHFYYITEDGSIHRYFSDSNRGVIAQLDRRFWENPNLLFNPPALADTNGLATVAVQNGVLSVNPASGFLGDLTIEVAVSDGEHTVREVFTLSVDNQPPVLLGVGNRTMSFFAESTEVELQASDPDGDPLTFSAALVSSDPVLDLFAELQAEHQFFDYASPSYYYNVWGWGEKWFAGVAPQGQGLFGGNAYYYYILEDGSIHRYNGDGQQTPVFAQLDRRFWEDPSLLFQPVINGPDAVTLTLNGNVLTVDPVEGFAGTLNLQVSVSDGLGSASDTFTVTVLDPASSQTQFLDVNEAEQAGVSGINDDSASGQIINGFGTGATEQSEAGVNGTLSTPTDVDFYNIDLEAGDILAAAVTGSATQIVLFDPNGTEVIGSTQDITAAIHPASSPLRDLSGNAVLAAVAGSAGRYSIAVDGDPGAYGLELRVYR